MVPIWRTPGHPIEVRGPEQLVVVADPDRIQQVVENLLSNATTHADPDTPISVAITQEHRADGDVVRITVTNQGQRMSPEQLRSQFRPFTKGSHSQGLGLGLYISQRIAQAHQGTLAVQTEGEKTTHLTLSIPSSLSVPPLP